MLPQLLSLLFSLIILYIVGLIAFLGANFYEERICCRLQKYPDWANNHLACIVGGYYIPLICIFSPCREEIMFRAPLILLSLLFFEPFSFPCWIAIILSSFWFAKGHKAEDQNMFGYSIFEPPNQILLYIEVFLIGCLFSFLGVHYQSVYPPLALHIALNLFALMIRFVLLYMIPRILNALSTMIETIDILNKK